MCLDFDAARLKAVSRSLLGAKRLTLQPLHAIKASNAALLFIRRYFRSNSSTRLRVRTQPKSNRTQRPLAASAEQSQRLGRCLSLTDERHLLFARCQPRCLWRRSVLLRRLSARRRIRIKRCLSLSSLTQCGWQQWLISLKARGLPLGTCFWSVRRRRTRPDA